jgi:hypothetical protein
MVARGSAVLVGGGFGAVAVASVVFLLRDAFLLGKQGIPLWWTSGAIAFLTGALWLAIGPGGLLVAPCLFAIDFAERKIGARSRLRAGTTGASAPHWNK